MYLYIPLTDQLLIPIVTSYGGWETILSADFQPTDKLYGELERAGLFRERFDRLRAEARPLYVTLLASWLYWGWRADSRFKDYPFQPDAQPCWRQHPENPFEGTAQWQDRLGVWETEHFSKPMQSFGISRDGIANYIEQNQDKYPKRWEPPSGGMPPASPSGVPSLPFPGMGGADAAEALPKETETPDSEDV